MIAGDPNVQSVELVVAALGELCDELVLVGGCAASLLIDAPSAPPPRVTYDVDLIAVVAALSAYHALERKIAERGFVRDMSPDAPICRWKVGAGGTARREYLAAQFAAIIAMPDFMNVLPGLVAFDELHGQRMEVVMNRIVAMAAMESQATP